MILSPKLREADRWKLRLLIHTHDSFKANADHHAAISAPQSHASLARAFLAEFCDDADLLAMVQYHDEPFAIWRGLKSKGALDQRRLEALLVNIQDWNLFLAFQIIDGCTSGKSREPVLWLFKEIGGRVDSTFDEHDILE